MVNPHLSPMDTPTVGGGLLVSNTSWPSRTDDPCKRSKESFMRKSMWPASCQVQPYATLPRRQDGMCTISLVGSLQPRNVSGMSFGSLYYVGCLPGLISVRGSKESTITSFPYQVCSTSEFLKSITYIMKDLLASQAEYIALT